MIIHATHVGFLPSDRKRAVLPCAGRDAPSADATFAVRACDRFLPGGTPVVYRGPLQQVTGAWGRALLADFSAVRSTGYFQVVANTDADRVPVSHPDASFPFFVGPGAYDRTLRLAMDYFPPQRCGQAAAGYHPACHLDDAVLRDTRTHRDAAGGWHDAGDVRKWMSHLLVYGLAFAELHGRLGPVWDARGSPWGDVLAEARWGNAYFLKMIDRDSGEVFHDVAGGINGDNSDCRWTDNTVGTGDERHVARVAGPGRFIQWLFVAVQARLADCFATTDGGYAGGCLDAARLALRWAPAAPTGRVLDDATAVIAFLALDRVDPRGGRWVDRARAFAASVVACQETAGSFGQTDVRGFLYADPARSGFFQHYAESGLPLYAIASLAMRDPSPDLGAFVHRYVHGYAAPMCGLTPYGVMPFTLYRADRPPVAAGQCRPLAGALSYRFFAWDRITGSPDDPPRVFEHGHASHVLSHAVGLLAAERVLGDGVARDLALRQVEWVLGANPAAACLMTGAGARSPYPFSPFVGVIPGGIVNGFNGGPADVPRLDPGNTLDWQTTEYCGIHNAHYLWAMAMLTEPRPPGPPGRRF